MYRITPDLIADVRSRTSLKRVIDATVKLQTGAKKGEYVGLCPFHSEKTPSFTVSEDKDFYHCFGCNAHGDAIDFIMALHGLEFADAVRKLADGAGIGGYGDAAPVIERTDTVEREAEKERFRKWARSIWKTALPASDGDVLTRYLRSRGITLPVPPSLRFAPSLYHSNSNSYCPAMVGAVQHVSGKIIGIHRTFLKTDGSGKAAVTPAKLMAGSCWTGAVRFSRPAPVVFLAEGIETALSVLQGMPEACVWAALSLGNLGAVSLPEDVKEVRIFADADNGDPVKAQEQIEQAAERHAQAGRRVFIAHAPDWCDFNDVLRGKHERDDTSGSPAGGGIHPDERG